MEGKMPQSRPGLVLTRKIGERLFIDVAGIRITVKLCEVRSRSARLHIEAPRVAVVLREELEGRPPRGGA